MKLLSILIFGLTIVIITSQPHEFVWELLNANLNRSKYAVAPASLHSSLTMAYLAANGKTAREMERVLHLQNTNKTEIALMQKLHLDTVTTVKSNFVYRSANMIYINRKFRISQPYRQLVMKYFNSTLNWVDFSKFRDIRMDMKGWSFVRKNILVALYLRHINTNANTTAMFTNTLYLRGKWFNHFEGGVFDKFHNCEGHKEYIWLKSDLLYADFSYLDASAIELELHSTDTRMLIILPNKPDELDLVVQRLKTVDLRQLSREMHRKDIYLLMPKPYIGVSYSLKSTLEKIGMGTVFSEGADFSGLVGSAPDFFISDVTQTLVVEFNFINPGDISRFHDPPPPPYKGSKHLFNVSHPFIFALKDDDHVYFVGHMKCPHLPFWVMPNYRASFMY